MKIVVPGLKIDLIDLSTNRADVGCDAEIAEPRVCTMYNLHYRRFGNNSKKLIV